MNNYKIMSRDGNVLLENIELPTDRVENLSCDSPEGFFLASQLDEIAEIGDVMVYAILR